MALHSETVADANLSGETTDTSEYNIQDIRNTSKTIDTEARQTKELLKNLLNFTYTCEDVHILSDMSKSLSDITTKYEISSSCFIFLRKKY